MISDSLRIALISETLEAGSPQRRRAAQILLDIFRSEGRLNVADGRVAAVCEEAGAAVAAEARVLLDRLGLGEPQERLSARSRD
jgi:hypothetical protein